MMEILKFDSKNQVGWIGLIRVLLMSDYCTERMIKYTLRVVTDGTSMNAIDLGLEIIYILVIEKKMIKINELLDFIGEESKTNDG